MSTFHAFMDTPLGGLRLSAGDEGLVGACFSEAGAGSASPPAASLAARRWLDAAREQLEAYFAGTCFAFDLPLAASGSAFRRAVWAELVALPLGATTSYGALARKLGRPNAARAVGMANATNPIAIIVPCHRVIGADGSLTGYAGGMDRKRWLLEHERRMLQDRPRERQESLLDRPGALPR
jgi:methylated-DNA-[protein]-cysteine S-methyltransferase